MQRTAVATLRSTVERLRRDTVECGEAPADVADYAARETLMRLSAEPARGIDRRAESYFRAVVKRRLVRHCAGTPHAVRLVVGTVVADLLDSGRSSKDTWDELARGWGHLLTPELSREFRERLCA